MAEGGPKAALASAGAPHGARERFEQLGLIDEPASALAAAEGVERRGPGRPPGSVNRATREFRDYLLSRYRSPVEAALRLGTARPADLLAWLEAEASEIAARTGVRPRLLPKDASMLELVELQRRCLEAAAPYLHSKMPVDVNVQSDTFVVHLHGGLEHLILAPGHAPRIEFEPAGGEPQKTAKNPGGDDAS